MASDLIDRTILLDVVENKYRDIVAGRYPFNIVAYDLSEIIKKQPTVDAVEVVRCKDCKYYKEGDLLAPNRFCYRLKHPTEDRHIGYNFSEDDYCSYGVKMASDLIRRKALLKQYEERYCKKCDSYNGVRCRACPWEDSLGLVEDAPTVDRWIPCSEELPPTPVENPIFDGKKLEIYLVSVEIEAYPFRALWNGKDFTDGFEKVEVIAWMPLPEPYKKGDIDE